MSEFSKPQTTQAKATQISPNIQDDQQEHKTNNEPHSFEQNQGESIQPLLKDPDELSELKPSDATNIQNGPDNLIRKDENGQKVEESDIDEGCKIPQCSGSYVKYEKDGRPKYEEETDPQRKEMQPYERVISELHDQVSRI